MAGYRGVRVEKLVMQLVSGMILRGEVKDPRVSALVSISDVTVSKDLSYADVKISGFLEDSGLERAAAGLNSAAGFIQTALGREMKTRNTPKLRFSVNKGIREGFEMARKLEALVDSHEPTPGSPPSR